MVSKRSTPVNTGTEELFKSVGVSVPAGFLKLVDLVFRRFEFGFGRKRVSAIGGIGVVEAADDILFGDVLAELIGQKCPNDAGIVEFKRGDFGVVEAVSDPEYGEGLVRDFASFTVKLELTLVVGNIVVDAGHFLMSIEKGLDFVSNGSFDGAGQQLWPCLFQFPSPSIGGVVITPVGLEVLVVGEHQHIINDLAAIDG